MWNFSLGFFSMMDEAKNNYQPGFFMEIFLLGYWHIWKQRNALIFNRGPPSQHSWRAGFLEEASLQIFRMNRTQKNVFAGIISSLFVYLA
jgi:hypothetical protein